jgi:hypothetical protein
MLILRMPERKSFGKEHKLKVGRDGINDHTFPMSWTSNEDCPAREKSNFRAENISFFTDDSDP